MVIRRYLCNIAPLVALLLLVNLRSARSRASDDIPSREQVVEILRAWRSSFANLWLVWESRNVGQLVKYHPTLKSKESLDGYYHKYEWIWDDRGRVRVDVSDYDDAVFTAGALTCVDGYRLLFFRASYSGDAKGSRVLYELSISPKRSSTPKEGFGLVVPLMGNWEPGRGEWLADALARGQGTFEAIETSDCTQLLRLRLNEYKVAWLDPSHDYLPIRVEPVNGRDGWMFAVTEYARSNVGIWYPAKGTIRANNEPEDESYHWLVTRFAANQPVDERLFQLPATGPGTKVMDRRVLHNLQTKPPIGEISLAAQNAMPSGRPVVARLPRSWWLPVSLLLMAIVFSVAAVWLKKTCERVS